MPSIGALTLDVSTPQEVGAAIARAVSFPWPSLGRPAPVEVTLAGTTSSLASIVGASPAARWYSPLLLRALASVPRPRDTRLARVVSFARQARQARRTDSGHGGADGGGNGGGHYRTRPSGSATRIAAVGGWPLFQAADSLWLVPEGETE